MHLFLHCWRGKIQVCLHYGVGTAWNLKCSSDLNVTRTLYIHERCQFTDGDYNSNWCTLLSTPILVFSLGTVRFVAKISVLQMAPFVQSSQQESSASWLSEIINQRDHKPKSFKATSLETATIMTCTGG